MGSIEKKANAFEEAANTDVFGDIDLAAEAKTLHHTAGKLIYKANRSGNKLLREVGEQLLRAADFLKTVQSTTPR